MHVWSKLFLYTETAIKEIATSNIKQKILRITCLVVEGIADQEALGKERVCSDISELQETALKQVGHSRKLD
jgi:uncharacterized protein YsxB (DUF464 family)